MASFILVCQTALQEYLFGLQFRSCFLLTVMKMSRWFQSTTTTGHQPNHRPMAEAALAAPLLGMYDVPVNDLAIAVVFYERHLLLLNQMTMFFDCPVNELNFL